MTTFLQLSPVLLNSVLGFLPLSDVCTVRLVCLALKNARAFWKSLLLSNADFSVAMGCCVAQHVRELQVDRVLWALEAKNSNFHKIAALVNLQLLDLSGNTVWAEGVEIISTVTSLQDLRLRNASDDWLKHISKMHNLTSLHLCNSSLSGGGLKEIVALQNLVHLDLNDSYDVDDDGLAHLSKLPCLKILKVSQSEVSDQGIAHLVALPLESLDVSHCQQVTNECVRSLCKIASLTELDASFTHVTAVGFNRLVKIKTLYLEHNNVTDLGLEHLSQVASLETLNLAYCCFTDQGLKHLSKLRLKRLLLENCANITDGACEHLGKIKSLEQLSLQGNRIGDKGVSKLTQLQKLNFLNLSLCKQISDKGLAHVAELQNLEQLGLQHLKRVTDEGLLQIEKLFNLVKLNLSGTKVSKNTATRLGNLKNLKQLNVDRDWDQFWLPQ